MAKPRKRNNVIIYRGAILWRQTEPGFKLRWNCRGIGSADTLAGMKLLVREYLAKLG